MRRLAKRRKLSNATMGVITLLTLLGVSLLVFTGVTTRWRTGGGTTYRAVFASTGLAIKGSPVRLNGVDVGQITDMSLDPGGRSTTVTMRLKDGALPIYNDAEATLSWRTLLGGGYAVNVTRGTPGAGSLSSRVISLARTTTQVELDDVLDTLQRPERRALRGLLRETPRALADHTAPAHAFADLSRIAPAAATALDALRGQRPDDDLRALVVNAERTIKGLDTPSNAMRSLVKGAAATVRVTARRRADIAQAIASADRAVPTARETLVDLDRTLALADPLVADLRRPAGQVAPALADLRPTLVEASAVIHRARPLLDHLRPAVASLQSAARGGKPLLDQLEPSLRRANDTILPDLAKVYPESGHTTYEMVGPTLEGLTELAGGFDNQTHLGSLALAVSDRLVDTTPCKSFLLEPKPSQLVWCEDIVQYFQRLFGYRPAKKSSKP